MSEYKEFSKPVSYIEFMKYANQAYKYEEDEKADYYQIPRQIDLLRLRSMLDKSEETNSLDIKLTDDIGVILNYPDMAEMYKGIQEGQTAIDFSLEMMSKSIRQIFEGETVHERADFSDKELGEFLESLTTEQFGKLQNFFETMPRLSHTVEVINPNTKKKNKVTLEGLNSFFV